MFEETNIKIYRFAESDIDRREAEVSISFQTQKMSALAAQYYYLFGHLWHTLNQSEIKN